VSRVAVLAGGRSSEHEVSLASGEAVRTGLVEAGHEVLDVRIGRSGEWTYGSEEVELRPGRGLLDADAVFPVLHGPFGEDGTLQGLLECLGVPYVGAGVLASALCMDKVLAKEVLARRGIPQVEYLGIRAPEWRADTEGVLARVAGLGLPSWVKPARLGSSVGIAKVTAEEEAGSALEAAFAHDDLVIVEASAFGGSAVEVECSLLGDEVPEVTPPGEIVLTRDWYDYEAKYTPGGMELRVPARISAAAAAKIPGIATAAWVATGCHGLARADFFVAEDRVLLNELNTMPGQTATSVYGALWSHAGVPYREVLDRLVGLGLRRHERQRSLAY